MSYPTVLSEHETLRLVLQGRSIGRYGDGELKFCLGSGIKSQQFDGRLAGRLRDVLKDAGACLVGIPNIAAVQQAGKAKGATDLAKQKVEFWSQYLDDRFAHLLADDKTFASAFITRPDSAPWIDHPKYWASLESLWKGRDVTLVRGSSKSLTAEDLVGAGQVTEIIAPRQHAFAEYKALLNRIGTPERALLCLGPTATVMAVDLCAKGVHAIDLGHVGMFLRKHRRGEPMWLTKDDKVQPA